ncbi:hypothetical protein AVDCRST_MAG81-722 [uncultured Synechococcales cyanobacterium]|uniref:Uncharacterized protein n=1 Tax=uncultured Synechococcales cyanobacterium TaxID=1936017 RepID=A0A6J4UTU5_9CYAN|nr:hypothetical protein AVDCRST_MAG81-722 [uncultured Synechococcales cyanobacterium]
MNRNKQQIQSISSKPGRLPSSRILLPERVQRIAQHLFQIDLCCG